MKNYLHLLSVGLIAAFALASCSQSRDLTTSQDNDNSRRYYKEYIGNKIVYHDRDEEMPESGGAIEDEDFETTEPETGIKSEPLTGLSEKSKLPEAGTESLKAMKSASKEKAGHEEKGFNVVETFKENHSDIVSGRIFTKKFHAERKANAQQSGGFGASEVFGLLALIFGAASISSFGAAAIGISFGVVAIVFGILGQDAGGPWGVFALVGFILGIVGAALSFIFIFA